MCAVTGCKSTRTLFLFIFIFILFLVSTEHWKWQKYFSIYRSTWKHNFCTVSLRNDCTPLCITLMANAFFLVEWILVIKIHSWQKGCYTPIEDNKTNVDRTFVFPLGWNWHDMDPWLFPNEIRHYLGQTFNARSSGIVELRNHSIGGRSPKSIFTLWQLWINICFSDCSNNAPSNPYGY